VTRPASEVAESTAPPAIDTDRPLREGEVDRDPVVEFQRWLDLAWKAGEPQANAMTLATSSPDGVPSARMVLLHRVDRLGFVFFTNYQSAKGAELTRNPRAALVFYWPRLHRQVRVSGTVRRTSRRESEDYWAQRPVGSRIAAAVSAQSRVLPSRQVLEQAVAMLEARASDGPPLPEFWGGFRVRPETIELWQGRTHRLHDRLRYSRRAGGGWRVDRLAP
jgi:pyridoxamine 5'-phosphate oxidase